MPLYSYKCASGHYFETFRPLTECSAPMLCEACGQPAEKQLAAPAVRGDYAAYSCPITGKRIEGRKAHEANLRRHGCRVLETGETEQAKRSVAKADEAFFNRVAETAAQQVATMPARKREQLSCELSRGLDVKIDRQTVK